MHSFTLLLSVTSVISHLPHSLADGLPHQVYNVTQVEPPLVAETISSTTTDMTTATITNTATTTVTTTLPLSLSPSPVSVLTVIYPSPDAAPVEVTSISQVVTSYIPEATWCLGPALYWASASGSPFFNGSANYTQVVQGTGYCGVQYSTTTTTVCATTLTGLASKITVTACDQEITFSSECGFTLETPTPTPTPSPSTTNSPALITPAPTIRRLTTYYLAPWQSLTAGTAPSSVDVKICQALNSTTTECQRYQEVWEIVAVTSTLTTSIPLTFVKTLSGPGTLVFASSTSYLNSTTEVVSLSSTLLLETEVTVESTSTRSLSQGSEEPTSTVTVTRHLEYVSG